MKNPIYPEWKTPIHPIWCHCDRCDERTLPQIPNGNTSTTADTKPEELSRTESLTDWYDHVRNV